MNNAYIGNFTAILNPLGKWLLVFVIIYSQCGSIFREVISVIVLELGCDLDYFSLLKINKQIMGKI